LGSGPKLLMLNAVAVAVLATSAVVAISEVAACAWAGSVEVPASVAELRAAGSDPGLLSGRDLQLVGSDLGSRSGRDWAAVDTG
jgi:hypothetical protein